MKKFVVFAVIVLFAMLSGASIAGPFDEGMNTYKDGNYSAAAKLLLPLAEKGDAFAQTAIGFMYSEGKGVQRDYVQACMWFSLAAASMESTGERPILRGTPAELMTEGQVAKTQRLARE